MVFAYSRSNFEKCSGIASKGEKVYADNSVHNFPGLYAYLGIAQSVSALTLPIRPIATVGAAGRKREEYQHVERLQGARYTGSCTVS